jgi:NTE family protein
MIRDGITLVLGGLGLKGVSHIGTLQAFEEHRIKINRIAVAGSCTLVAFQYALSRDLNALSEHFIRFFNQNDRYLWGLERLAGASHSRNRRVRDSLTYFLRERLYCQGSFKKISLLEWDRFEEDILNYFGDLTFSDLQLPVSVSSIDLTEGKEILIENGDLADAIKAGIAFPGLFPPAMINHREHVSSTFFCELPLNSLKAPSGDPVVVIDIPAARTPRPPSTIIETLARVDEIRSRAIKQELLKKADIVFTLEELARYPWGDYRHIPWQIFRAHHEMDVLLTSY